MRAHIEQNKLTFQNPDLDSFKTQLKNADYYASMTSKYDASTWGLLEKYTGKLA